MKNKLRYIPAIFYMCIMWYLSSIQIVNELHGQDKTAHILEYVGLAFLWTFALREKKSRYIVVFLIGLTWGALDEFHQYFVPTRSMDFLDLISDAVGLIIGILIYNSFFLYKKTDRT